MAIDAKTCKDITRRTLEMWNDKAANDDVFLNLTHGKERGHRMADFVDERTTDRTPRRSFRNSISIGTGWQSSGAIDGRCVAQERQNL
jgi:hypothetical protein